MIDLLQYLGSAIAIIHSVPQIIRAAANYRRYGCLKDLSLTKEVLCLSGTACLFTWALLTENYGLVVLNFVRAWYSIILIELILRGRNYERNTSTQTKAK